jgi:CDP-diacylglycerol pyrophosphatase
LSRARAAGGRSGRRLAIAAVLLVATLSAAGLVRAHDPQALWRIVDGRCVPDQQRAHDPAPCAVVDQPHGFAMLKDRVGAEQFLLIPTARIAGIESPELLQPDAPNYFADAWAEVPLVEARLHRPLPREDVSLAINSAHGRSQDQMHIHIDCIGRAARDALAAQAGRIGAGWTELELPPAGHRYRAMRIAGGRLDGANPLRLLAASLRDPAGEMGRHTLVLVGARLPAPGFVLLDGAYDHAAGEELQDHACGVARDP